MPPPDVVRLFDVSSKEAPVERRARPCDVQGTAMSSMKGPSKPAPAPTQNKPANPQGQKPGTPGQQQPGNRPNTPPRKP